MHLVETFFTTCAPGLEDVLHEEARELKLSRIERQVGGVRFEGTLEDAWRANLWFATGIRVLWRRGRFTATNEDELYEGVREIDWTGVLAPDGTLAVSAQTKESALDHSLYVVHRTKDAIVDQIRERTGTRPNVDKDSPDLAVHVHIWRDRVTVSVDTTGTDSLHKRGWREYQGPAPLAETLAAALLRLSGWDRRSPLVDPFCGSGTILVEAALWAAGMPPGAFRDEFGFERLLGHDTIRFEEFRQEAIASANPPAKLILRGHDTDRGALRGARRNLAAIGLQDRVELEVADARSIDWRANWNAWIVTNPPYGERIGARDLPRLYREFAAQLRERCGGYHLALLTADDPKLLAALAFPDLASRRVMNGAIPCQILGGRIPADSTPADGTLADGR